MSAGKSTVAGETPTKDNQRTMFLRNSSSKKRPRPEEVEIREIDFENVQHLFLPP